MKKHAPATVIAFIVAVALSVFNFSNVFDAIFNGSDQNAVDLPIVPMETIPLSEDVETLLENVKIGDGDDYSSYDRTEWTSKYQYYSCKDLDHNDDGTLDCPGKYSSIRKYSFYESDWYDWEKDQYIDPYTNDVITDISKVDYDHIIPLAYAHAHGAALWTEEQKREFADDPTVGVCCSQFDNRAKGAKGPSEWMPSANQASYCYTWLIIANRFNLWLEQEDYDVIIKTLKGYKGELSIINPYHND